MLTIDYATIQMRVGYFFVTIPVFNLLFAITVFISSGNKERVAYLSRGVASEDDIHFRCIKNLSDGFRVCVFSSAEGQIITSKKVW